jgi:release factor glutamine methyltransferase
MPPTVPGAHLSGTDAGSLVTTATERLRAAGSPTPRLDAELLVAHAFGRDRTWLVAHPDAPLDGTAATQLAAWLERRADGEPVAYIRGFKEWLSLRVLTDRRALIPRPDTELLAQAAIDEIATRLARDSEPIAAWEVATGSGAITLALALRFRTSLALGRLRLAASDIAPEALELASDNLAAAGVSGLVALGCGDLLDPPVLPAPLEPNVVIANLPYLTTEEASADEGSLRYEPRSALDGGTDGLDLIRRLLAQLPNRLAPGGTAVLEIGAGQANAVRALVAALPMGASVATLPDLAGIERVVRVDRS